MAFSQFSLGLLTVALLGFFAQGSFGLQCHICDSAVTPDCTSNPAAIPAQDCSSWCQSRGGYILDKDIPNGGQAQKGVPCPSAFTSCRKIVQSTTTKEYNGGNADSRVIRTCGYLGGNDTKPYDYRSSEAVKSEILSCTVDACNSAVSMQASVFVALLIAAFCRFLN